ncbi:hypothetical protein BDR04DRAFT_1087554 [Suillus decipiens]|nr:hypothetical protein BDR04DRAFT_1087554 [Suillus decipiens]
MRQMTRTTIFGSWWNPECQNNLTVRTFETLEKLRNNHSYHVHQRALAAGQPVDRKHAHMHTRNNGGIDTDLAMDLDTNFAWTPLISQSQADVQQVGFDLNGNISWDVQSLLTMKAVSSM